MSTSRDEILRELGQKMLDEIDGLLRRFAEERAVLLNAEKRLGEIDARVAVLNEERARLLARGQSRTPENESRLIAADSRGKVAE